MKKYYQLNSNLREICRLYPNFYDLWHLKVCGNKNSCKFTGLCMGQLAQKARWAYGGCEIVGGMTGLKMRLVI